MKQVEYLIIGNGIAGLSAAKEIRKNDRDGNILMVSREPYLTYYRPRLTNGLYEGIRAEDILVHKESWYKENDIQVLLNRHVNNIDVENNRIELSEGETIGYKNLLLATGSYSFCTPYKGGVNKRRY